MTEIVLPEDSNARGTIFGGRVLSLIDKCAAVAAMRHARSGAVTVSLDRVVFVSGVHVGDVLVLRARLNAAFRTSMEIEVRVEAEDRATGVRRLTTTAWVTMVAVDDDGRPRPIPALEATCDDDRRRVADAAARRAARLADGRPPD